MSETGMHYNNEASHEADKYQCGSPGHFHNVKVTYIQKWGISSTTEFSS